MYIARELRCIARKALKGFWGLSLGVTLVYMILGGAGGAFNLNFSGGTANQQITSYVENSFYGYYFTAALVVAGILSIVAFLIGGPMRQGLCRYNIDLLTRENQPSFNALFSQFKNFGNAFGLNFMINLFTALWTLLFIIPGIIAAYRYALAPYLMVENPRYRRNGGHSPVQGADEREKMEALLSALQLHRLDSVEPAHAGRRSSVGKSLYAGRDHRILSGRHRSERQNACA